eukprot:gene31987-38677_t
MASFALVNEHLLEKAKELWLKDVSVYGYSSQRIKNGGGDNVGISTWYILSLLATNTRREDMDWLWSNDCDLGGRLAYIFLTRKRQTSTQPPATKPARTQSHKPSPKLTQQAYTKVDSWRNVSTNILSTLPSHILDAWCSGVVARLNVVFAHGEANDEAIEKGVWCEDLLDFIKVLSVSMRNSCSVLSEITLFQPAHWPAHSHKPITQFTLDCLNHLLSTTDNTAANAYGHTATYICVHDVKVYIAITQALLTHVIIQVRNLTETHILPVQDLIHSCHHALSLQQKLASTVSSLTEEHRLKAVRTILARINSAYSDGKSDGYGDVSTYIKLLQTYLGTNANTYSPTSKDRIRLNTPLPSPGSVRNKKACYISQQVSTNPASTQFTPVPCTILSVHFDNGIHKPYYTISLDGEGREIQTEWHRLLVYEDGDDKTGYAAGDTDRVVGVSDALEIVSNASTAASSDTSIPALLYTKVLETLSSLCTLSHTLSSSKAASAARNMVWAKFITMADMLCVLLPALAASASSSSISDTLNSVIAPIVRGLATSLSIQLSQYPRLVHILSRLMVCICRTSGMLGNGWWVMGVVYSVWNDMLVNDMNTSKTATSRTSILEGYISIFTSLMSVIRWPSMGYICSVGMLPTALANNTSASSSYTRGLVRLICEYVQGPRDGDGEVKRDENGILGWQMSSLELIVSRFVHLTSVDSLDSHTVTHSAELLDTLVCLDGVFLHMTRSQQSQLLLTCPILLEHIDHFYALALSLDNQTTIQANADQSTPALLLLSLLYPSNLISSVRGASFKILDIFHTTSKQHPPTDATSLVNVGKSEGKSDGEDDEDEDEYKDDERNERILNEHIFHSIIGTSVNTELDSRFVLSKVQARAQQASLYATTHTSANLESDEEDGDGDVDVDGDSSVYTAQTSLTSATSATHSHHSRKQLRAQRREFIQAWSSVDPLGSVIAWLLALQSIDSACNDSQYSAANARIRCSNHLKNS